MDYLFNPFRPKSILTLLTLNLMRKKIFVFAVLLLLTCVSVTDARKRKVQKKETTTLTSERHEIDNFDFLYNGSDYEDYNVSATEDLMSEAFSHIGTRYRSGAKGPYAFDCSGFTSYVFRKFGENIGSCSRDQYAKNQPISRGDLQTGDLVFFTSRNSGRGVGHVGIVVDVNGDGTFSFIHASTSEGVKVSQSTDGYYARRYVGARRVM